MRRYSLKGVDEPITWRCSHNQFILVVLMCIILECSHLIAINSSTYQRSFTSRLEWLLISFVEMLCCYPRLINVIWNSLPISSFCHLSLLGRPIDQIVFWLVQDFDFLCCYVVAKRLTILSKKCRLVFRLVHSVVDKCIDWLIQNWQTLIPYPRFVMQILISYLLRIWTLLLVVIFRLFTSSLK